MVILQQKKKGQYWITIPKRDAEWLLWKAGDNIIVNRNQSTLKLELCCFERSILKEALLKKEREQDYLRRVRDTRLHIDQYDEVIRNLQKEKEALDIELKGDTKKTEASKLGDDIEQTKRILKDNEGFEEVS